MTTERSTDAPAAPEESLHAGRRHSTRKSPLTLPGLAKLVFGIEDERNGSPGLNERKGSWGPNAVLAAIVLGAVAGALVLFVEPLIGVVHAPAELDVDERRFLAIPQAQLWVLLVVVQTGLWVVLGASAPRPHTLHLSESLPPIGR
ncbi:MAG: hypothetical protein M3P39_04505 [Actinomycetota bacterium]|nr:hypothetical protein [Actinomycetota bacterium]